MGCDIHTYIEYKPARYDGWLGFGGQINPGRNYELFGRLAGVRTGEEPLHAVRGIPSDLGFDSLNDYWLYVSEGPEEPSDPGVTTADRAEAWIHSGIARRHPEHPKRVSCPDWHTPTWLNPDEFEAVLKSLGYGVANEPEYFAVLAAMRTLEQSGAPVRIVFWFDN